MPDIYDSAKYDAIHNGHLALGPLKVCVGRMLAYKSRQITTCTNISSCELQALVL